MPLLLTPETFIISIVLFLILFFGMGFILNMLLKTTWLPGAIIYPIVIILMISDVSFWNYFLHPIQSLTHIASSLTRLLLVDYIILLSGLIGAVMSGISIQMLRRRGYKMF